LLNGLITLSSWFVQTDKLTSIFITANDFVFNKFYRYRIIYLMVVLFIYKMVFTVIESVTYVTLFETFNNSHPST
ncbi:hypothetical protein L9F63_012294, partial [Diploptera punctata]